MTVDRARAEQAIAEFLAALGYKNRQFSETPTRVVSAFVDELLQGEKVDVEELIASGGEESTLREPVVLSGIEVSTVCPHHLLVAQGKADVIYFPQGRVLGLGTLARLVNAYAQRLILQEEIAPSVVAALVDLAGARGAFCRLTLDHACLQARGPVQRKAEATTWAVAGHLEDPQELDRVLLRLNAQGRMGQS